MPRLAAALFAAAGLTARPVAPPPARTLDVVATEFAFAAPDTVAAGRTRVRLTSRGRELHLLEVARLDGGHTAEELVAHLAARRGPPAWATFVGGPLPPPPDGALTVTLDLAPGRYALLCPIPSPGDHRPHMTKGMARTLVVVPPPRAVRPPPATPAATDRAVGSRAVGSRAVGSRAVGSRAAAGRVVLDDYGFVLDPAWRAGRHTLHVENRAAQPHELAVFRLGPGRRAADVVRWARSPSGPPPGAVVGGVTALSRGQAAAFDVALAPGAYALLCFLPDATDGRSHVAHGMVRELTVR